ncbi:histidine phosphatase family protein [Skermania sp. ID1734]|uniref:histidine phosphatase family protein n=1 Tax=Skermania sp. ID1734 TaxID=2597516 RepID=UPI0011812204|nr:histidine phosphatase family protein [Skermania sp. ID1734]TSE00786.1 histidine phosphatase family protein [Skermania sp. ID1734]
MSTLFLVRHGETEGNVARRLDTRLPGAPLTSRGVEQAQAFARGLTVPPAAVIASRALRAQQTASHIEAVTGVETQVLDGLHEAQAGDYEDRADDDAHEALKAVFGAWHLGDLDARLPGGESGQEVLDRFLPVVGELRAKYLDTDRGNVVVVSHGAAIRLVSRYLAAVPGQFAASNHLDNTQTIELEPTATGWRCTRWGLHTPPFEADVSPRPDDPMG